MRKLLMFNMISLDGYYEGPGHDISWHTVDAKFNDFAIEQLNAVDTLIFGKRTYELMVGYWPTDEGVKDSPAIAALMNNKEFLIVHQRCYCRAVLHTFICRPIAYHEFIGSLSKNEGV